MDPDRHPARPGGRAKVSATFADGVLTVTLPKAEEARPRQINVTPAAVGG